MGQRKVIGYVFLSLICAGTILPVFSAPPEGRKYAVKSNNPKKVFHKQTIPGMELQQPNQQQHQPIDQNNILMNKASDIGSPSDISGGNGNGGFPWSFLSNSLMQLVRMFFGVPNEMSGNGLTPGSDKMDGPSSGQGFSWGQVIGYGLKLAFAALGGTNNNIEHDGVDKIGVEGGATPVQGLMKTLLGALVGGEEAGGSDNMAKQTGELINLAIALMNALKQSFSQRAMRARSLGEKDKMTELTLAAIDMGKAYARTFNTTNDSCKEQRICEAARECSQDVGQANAYGLCHLSAYATANLMYYTQSGTKDNTKLYMEAARKGRSHQDCKQLYSLCNEIA